MPIQNASDSQKIDYLWKKIVYGAAKTDIAGNIDATQEPYASPLLIRGDKIWQDATSIPAVIPGSNTAPVTVYTTSLPVECTSAAGIPTPTLTWITGQTNWVPPEFGSTYQVKVYISPSGQAGNVLTKGTQVFATGSGSNDLWVFDYQSGILNFNSNNTPYNGASPISFTGNSVYISGAVYSGELGFPTTFSNINLGNLYIEDTTISSTSNITIASAYPGIVKITGNSAVQIPAGDDQDRPDDPTEGYIRYNTSRNGIEFWDGAQWQIPGEVSIISDIFTPDGVSNVFILTANTSTQGVLVSINGTVQRPQSAYTVSNNAITFTEVPLTTDIIEVRTLATGAAVSSDTLGYNNSLIVADGTNLTVTGNLIPSANITYSLGSQTNQWKDLWISGNTLYLGGAAITISNGQLSVSGNTVGAADPYGNINVKAYADTMAYTNYSNVNVKAYADTMAHTNYSNVNTASYLGGSFGVGTITAGSWEAGTIAVTHGGTGATTAIGALTNLLPGGAQTGYVLTTSGSGSYYWAVGSGGGGVTIGQSLTTLRQSNTASSGQTVFNLVNDITYTPGAGQLRVYINGVRQFPDAYTETSANSYTLSTGVTLGTVVFAEIDAFSSFNNYANLTYASNIGNIAASGLTVQGAIDSLENNKAPLAHPVFTGVTTVVGNLVVQGNLFVNGNVTSINANNLSISDSIIYLADDNPADTLDIGIVSSLTDAVRYQHTGFVRDATDGTWKLFANVVPEPTTTVDFTNASYSNLQLGNLTAIGGAFTGTVTANNVTINGLTTLSETTETLDTKSSVTGTVVHDFSTTAIWYYSSISGNVTANITNVPTTNNRITSISMVVNQGVTGYIVNGLQIDGAAQTIRWQANTVPTASTNRVDVFTFSLLRAANAWTVLGSATSHG
jgi:hypothetical protein